jgi:hypothetical protein
MGEIKYLDWPPFLFAYFFTPAIMALNSFWYWRIIKVPVPTAVALTVFQASPKRGTVDVLCVRRTRREQP